MSEEQAKYEGASASPTACSPTAEPPVSAGVSSASPLRPTGAGFTEGPWEEIPQHGAGPMIARRFDTGNQMNPTGLRLICHVMQRRDSLLTDEANAALIAAAPDLYEALVEARLAVAADVEAADDPDGQYSGYRDLFAARLAKIDLALSKALGKAA
jgi:hypothetical protein